MNIVLLLELFKCLHGHLANAHQLVLDLDGRFKEIIRSVRVCRADADLI